MDKKTWQKKYDKACKHMGALVAYKMYLKRTPVAATTIRKEQSEELLKAAKLELDRLAIIGERQGWL